MSTTRSDSQSPSNWQISDSLPSHPEPYKIKMIEPIHLPDRKTREAALQEAGFNIFNIPSDHVFIDLLTDSGTGAMSEHQWASLMEGDESYAGSSSFFRFKNAVQDVMGFEYVLPTHQGRAAENVLHSVLVHDGDIVPGNSHFDTTKAHIEFRHAHAIDCTIDACFVPENDEPFKGNVDLAKLAKVVDEHGVEKIPFVLITVTNNSGGGQPVSLTNVKEVAAFCHERNLKLIIDAARFAENAWFIQQREPGQRERSVREIAKEVFSYADAATMSAKKDAIVNMGGMLCMRDEELFDQCSSFNILFEGYITYGGLSGRDMEALATGLYEGTEDDYLSARIGQVRRFGDSLTEAGIPIVRPPGGHAIYVDAKKFLPHLDQEQFPAQALVCELYLEGGIRGVEIGTVLADRDPDTGKNRPPKLELMRMTIPRRVYTENHLQYVRDVLVKLWERRDSIRGLKFTYEPPILRHFRARFEWE
ncbi:MAG TPA: tryptophanase [Bacteroidetes bacterium]|nr:tyrosine phenol-lyase [bacterium BMS3Bbin04]HDO65770.1 tryptophanase [Bacteroidota bacterium]HEX04895.1 tryptophanase [Bacteroidota bacterium]